VVWKNDSQSFGMSSLSKTKNGRPPACQPEWTSAPAVFHALLQATVTAGAAVEAELDHWSWLDLCDEES